MLIPHADGPLSGALELSSATSPAQADVDPEPDAGQVSRQLLTLGIGLSVLVAAGGLLQALASGLGPNPAFRLAIGLSLLALSSGALLLRAPLHSVLRDSGWVILVVAGVQTAFVSLDGLPGSPYFASCLIPIGIAMIAGPGLSWLCAGVVDGVLVLTMVGLGPAPSFEGGAGTAIGALLAPPASVLALTTLTRAYERATRWVARQMAEPTAPSLGDVPIQRLLPPAPIDEAPAPWVGLTPAEMEVARALARLGTTGQIALEREVAWSTVDNQLAEAMKKTGCRTRLQLAALTAHPAWPEHRDED